MSLYLCVYLLKLSPYIGRQIQQFLISIFLIADRLYQLSDIDSEDYRLIWLPGALKELAYTVLSPDLVRLPR